MSKGNDVTSVWNISWSHDPPDLFHALQVGTQAPVATENLLVNDSCNREAVEAVCEGFPELDAVPALACTTKKQ